MRRGRRLTSWRPLSCPGRRRVALPAATSGSEEKPAMVHSGGLTCLLCITLGIAAALTGAAKAAEEEPAQAKIKLKKGDKLIFFGDSLTALAIKDGQVPEGKGYVPLV